MLPDCLHTDGVQEIGSRFTTRIEDTCIKHRFGKVGVKMYNKFGRVLLLGLWRGTRTALLAR